jgi:hypothetical protein
MASDLVIQLRCSPMVRQSNAVMTILPAKRRRGCPHPGLHGLPGLPRAHDHAKYAPKNGPHGDIASDQDPDEQFREKGKVDGFEAIPDHSV